MTIELDPWDKDFLSRSHSNEEYQREIKSLLERAAEYCSRIQQLESQVKTEAVVPVGDVNSDSKGSGARFNDGKASFELIPLCTLEDEARVWAHGQRKYASWNWAKGMAWSVPFACAMRHLAAWQRGEELDPESGLPHLAHAMCNLRMLTLYSKTFPEGDDRPTKWMPKP
jgi:hypothetical protein